jgi:hypothetical protein
MGSDVRQILAAIESGDPGASEALLLLVYQEFGDQPPVRSMTT